MDKVIINNLSVDMIIGVYAAEQTASQPIIIDIECETCFHNVFNSQYLGDTLDYAKLSQEIYDFCSNTQYDLLETLAKDIMILVFEYPMVSKISLGIKKPKALKNEAIARIFCVRTREQMQKSIRTLQ